MLSVGDLDTSHVVSGCRRLPRFLNLLVERGGGQASESSCVQRHRSS